MTWEAGVGQSRSLALLAGGMELWLVVLLLVVVVLHWIGARALLQRTDGRMVVLVVLGSGGHTSEMLSMLGALEERLKRGIVFVVAETDKMSQQRAARLFPGAEFVKTPRAREVHQSWLTTVFTTFVAALHAIKIVFEQQPDLVHLPETALRACEPARQINLDKGYFRLRLVEPRLAELVTLRRGSAFRASCLLSLWWAS